MIVALLVLMIIGSLTAVAVAVAVQTNNSTRQDAARKNALEAAEAGLQVAVYRLNMLRPDDTHCIADNVTSPSASTPGWCPASSTYTLGNGSTYQYWTTPILGSGSTCVGSTISSSTNISNRCVTAVGVSNGITERSQIRTDAFGAVPLFPYGGIIGMNGVTNGNNAVITGGEVSNKVIGGGNNNTTITGGVTLGPGGVYTGPGNPTQQRLTSPVVASPVNPGTSNQTSLASCPDRQAAGYPSCNDDYRITNYLNNPTHPTSPYDQVGGGVTFNAATRTLTMGVNSSIVLGGGLYNFCEIDINNNATISLAPGVYASIFVDSPDDPGSGCPAGTGSFNFKNNVTWVNPQNDPTALQIYVYGWNNGLNTVNFWNNGNCACVLYAPLSTINLSHNSNNSDLTGAVFASSVWVPNNFNFTWDERAGTLQVRTTGLYYRSAWAQCRPASSSASNPGANCG